MQENKNSYIVSINSILYMIPQDRYNGILDMVNVGNQGKNGERAIIEEIERLKNIYILVVPSSVINGANQNPKKTIEYIEETFEYIGNLDNFNIYYKK